MPLIQAFSNLVEVTVAKNEGVSRTHFGNKAWVALLRRMARAFADDKNLEYFEKYALADAVATLAVHTNRFVPGERSGFHCGM